MNTAHKQKHAISPRQIKALHAQVNKLGLDDDTYRDMLKSRYGVTSCKGLSWRQADELMDSLNSGSRPEARGPRKTQSPAPSASRLKYTDMDGRPGMATGAQCRFIAAMFGQVTRAEDPESAEKALNSFCSRIAQVAGLRMVRGWQVEKIIKALESMGAVKKEA